jgi:hypothetical protein
MKKAITTQVIIAFFISLPSFSKASAVELVWSGIASPTLGFSVFAARQ